MSECSFNNKGRIALLASVAANIFLVAFVLGNTTAHRPPPFEPRMGRGGLHMMGPRMMGPGDLFGPNEVRADEERMRENFTKLDGLRKAFAVKLEAGPVSKEEALKHFTDVDEVLQTVKKDAQERAATRISSMSEEDRKALAKKLSRLGPPFGGKGGVRNEPNNPAQDPGAPQPPMDEPRGEPLMGGEPEAGK